MKVIIRRQAYLCTARRAEDPPDWVVTLCYQAVKTELGRSLRPGEEIVADFILQEMADESV